MTIYDFDNQRAKGEAFEQRLDQAFSYRFDVTPATPDEQRQGIDRHFTDKTNGRHLTVEYKADSAATRTGNAFVETVSVDTANKPGWAYTSRASYLIYFLPGDDLAHIFTFLKIRNQLPRWIASYPSRAVKNRAFGKNYNTIGVLVPLVEFERHAIAQVAA